MLKIHGVLACKLIASIDSLDYQFLLYFMETIACSTTVQYMEIGCFLSCLFIMTHNLTSFSLLIGIKKKKSRSYLGWLGRVHFAMYINHVLLPMVIQ